jgi:hypothetical protein
VDVFISPPLERKITMQSSVVRTTNEETDSAIEGISRQITSLAAGTKLEVENFKFATQKVENGVTFEFAIRATVRFGEKEQE